MTTTEPVNTLALTDVTPAQAAGGSGDCGCGGCGCGSKEGSAAAPEPATDPTTSPASRLVTGIYQVTGMTCGHCVAAVSEELRALDGVTDVNVDLAPDGPSTVTVHGTRPLEVPELAAALAEAGGYQVA